MFVNSNQATCCAYGGKDDHFSTCCSKITDVNLRKNHLRKTGRCFICLNKGHLARDCKVEYSCIKCKQRHNISICSKSKLRDHANSQETVAVSDRNHRNVTMHINSYNRSILLQTATAKVYNTSEN